MRITNSIYQNLISSTIPNQNKTKLFSQPKFQGTEDDNLELSQKNKNGLLDKIKKNKKRIIIGLLGLTAIIGGIYIAYKKGLFNKLFSSNQENFKVQEIINQKDEILDNASKEYNEVLLIFKKGKENNFVRAIDEVNKTERRFIDSTKDPFTKIIEELKDNQLIRRSTIKLSQNPSVVKIEKGITQTEQGKEKIAEILSFDKNGRLTSLHRGKDMLTNGIAKFKEVFLFGEDKTTTYLKDCTETKEKVIKAAEGVIFTDKKTEYIIDYSKLADGTVLFSTQ